MTDQQWLEELLRIRYAINALQAKTPHHGRTEIANRLRQMSAECVGIRVEFQQAVKRQANKKEIHNEHLQPS